MLIVGLCLGDPAIYSANSRPEMKDFVDSCMAAWEHACRKQHIDLVVPMTHQLIDDDRLLAEQFEMHETMNGKAPVILGGHEHTVFEEVVADSLIVKTGQDASKIAVVDLYWTSSGVKCQHVLLDAKQFQPQSQAAAWAAGKQKFVDEAMKAGALGVRSTLSILLYIRLSSQRSYVGSKVLKFLTLGHEIKGPFNYHWPSRQAPLLELPSDMSPARDAVSRSSRAPLDTLSTKRREPHALFGCSDACL